MTEDPREKPSEAASDGAENGAENGDPAATGESVWQPPEDVAAQPDSDAEQLAALQAENDELRDRLLRAAAEMENLRRRTEREKQDAGKYAISRFAQDVLSVGDNLARALQLVDEETRKRVDEATGNLIEGVEMTERELHNVLARHGIEKLAPEGERFDPHFHQAMFEVENPEVASGTVVQVVQEGYTIGERVLRPALVGVSKGGAKARPETADAAEDAAPQAANENAPRTENAQPSPQKPGGEAAGEGVGRTVDKSA